MNVKKLRKIRKEIFTIYNSIKNNNLAKTYLMMALAEIELKEEKEN